MSHSETNLLKFELGILNNLADLLYLPLVSGDNTLSAARQLVSIMSYFTDFCTLLYKF
jgi:hypothetical protein